MHVHFKIQTCEQVQEGVVIRKRMRRAIAGGQDAAGTAGMGQRTGCEDARAAQSLGRARGGRSSCEQRLPSHTQVRATPGKQRLSLELQKLLKMRRNFPSQDIRERLGRLHRPGESADTEGLEVTFWLCLGSKPSQPSVGLLVMWRAC